MRWAWSSELNSTTVPESDILLYAEAGKVSLLRDVLGEIVVGLYRDVLCTVCCSL